MRLSNLLPALMLLATTLAPAQQPSLTTFAPLAGHRPTWAIPTNDRGPIPDATPIPLILALTRSPERQSAFDQLLIAQQNPASPSYHHWLTPTQIGEQFGPTPQDLEAVTTWLTSRGITIEAITPSRTYIQATAPAAIVSAAFQTSLHTYTLGTRTTQAPTSDPIIPAALTPVIAYISGLTQTPFHTSLHQTAPIPVAQTNLSPDYTLSSGAVHLLAPTDFAIAYDVTPVYTAGTTGTGQRVAIVGGSRLLPSDLTTWESLSGLPAAQPTYIVPTGTGFADPGMTSNTDQGEGTLDFERVYGTAPGVSVDQIISTNWLNGTVTENLILYAINTVRDPILSLSFGACEAQQTPAYINYESSVFAQAAAQGIGVFVSSGDAGAAGCESQGTPPATQALSISDLCASQYVTCVGGTQFSDLTATASYWSTTNNATNHSSILSYIPEGAWNEPTSTTPATPFVVGASGGGKSTVIAKPTYQAGTGVPADAARDVPDISFSASTHNGYFSCLAYAGADCTKSLLAFGGTSASAPSMAGVAALLNQKLGAAQGNLNPLLYRLAASTPTAFHDPTPATSGVSSCTTTTASTCNNSTPSATALTGGLAGFPLTTGYDQVTGLGSLDVSAFLTAATPAITPTPTFTLVPTTTALSTTAGTPITDVINIATTSNFTGQIAFTCAVSPVTSITPTCTITPASLAYPATTSTTLTIGSTAPHANLSPRAAIAFAAIFLLAITRRRKTLRPALASLATLLFLAGCGSGGSNGTSTPTTLTGGTTPGTYTVTVTASTATPTTTLSISTNLTLIVN
ncbi:S53 family peptidase [Granulicella tundricola]|uniref:Peptidase S53 propeptide n=1 Tax=Granulicella tundricola (strain ATCC BAA-1859 / DSM 23138 / MP5ACTX9) TaxID=1198114 RepID=E8X0I6_GRATM|nr:S53 family peptidase [Granulicella tundricola]ADW67850.1 Peptidase S53 propeptide [Granulicella tundricola MP5ACTX9]